MANENMVTIPLDEYIDLRRKADENLYLASELGAFRDRLYTLENRMCDLEMRIRDGK